MTGRFRWKLVVAVAPLLRFLPDTWAVRIYAHIAGSPFQQGGFAGRVERRPIQPHRYEMELCLDDWMERSARFLGFYYEYEATATLQRLLGKGDFFVDVGANVGFMTLTAARLVGPEGKVIAFEPNRSLVSRLRNCLRDNRIDNVVVFDHALGDAEGEAILTSGGHAGAATLRRQGTDGERITIRAGDAVLPWIPPPVRVLVKLDVEGYEFRALLGLRSLIARPNTGFLIEVTDAWLRELGASAEELFALLSSSGYSPFHPRMSPWSTFELRPLEGPLTSQFQYDVVFLRTAEGWLEASRDGGSAKSSTGKAASSPGGERSRILGEGAWNAAGQAATAAARLVGTRILTGLVSPSVYGEANLLIGLATLGSNLFCAPLLHATLRFYPDAERDARVVSLRRLLVSLLLVAATLVLVLIVSGGAVWSFSTNDSLPFACFLVLGAFFAFDTARLFETNLLNSARRHSTFSLWSVADAWAKPIAAVAAAVLVAPTTLGMLSGYAVGTGAVLLLFRRTTVGKAGGNEASGGDAWSASLRSNVLGYAAPIVPLAILGWTSNLGDRYILAAFSGASAAGLYTAAYGLASQPFLLLSGVLSLTLRPVLFEAVALGDRVRERRTVLVWLGAVSLCSFVGVVAVWLAAVPLVGLLLGSEFQGAAPLLVWIAAAYALQSVQQVFETMLYAQRRTKSLVTMQSVATVSGLLLYFLLIPRLGAIGAAMGTCASLAASGTASILLARPWERFRALPRS